jgi:hypothetical protein
MSSLVAFRGSLKMFDRLPCPDGWNFGGGASLQLRILGAVGGGSLTAGNGSGYFRGRGIGLGFFTSSGNSNVELRNRPKVESCCEAE